MAPKRSPSNIDDDDANEGGRELKKQKTAPHRGKLDAVLQDFLDFLSPATGGSLADFNDDEKQQKRRGVVPINIRRVQMELGQLRVAKDIESLDAGLVTLDTYLKGLQDECAEYMVDTPKAHVKRTLDEVIWQVQAARDLLPGMLSHCMDYCEI